MLPGNIEPIFSNGVAAKGVRYLIPSGVGTDISSWTDD